MGLLGFILKGNSFRFVSDIQLIQCIAILFGLFNLSVCLFEDQIGKFDWLVYPVNNFLAKGNNIIYSH